MTVESEDENVKVMRKGDLVQVFVDKKAKPGKDGKAAKGGEEVRVEVPVSLVDAFLSGEGEEGNIQAAVGGAAEAARRHRARARTTTSNVRVWIDEQNTQSPAGK